MREAYIVAACRTPLGKFMGGLNSFSAVELGTLVVGEAVRRAHISAACVDEVIMGNVLSAGLGQNPARQAALGAGIPVQVGALTINKVCGSGLKAVILARQALQVGDGEVVVAGGMESMSRAPLLLSRHQPGAQLGGRELLDSMLQDGLWDAYHDYHMGCTAELISEKYHLSRRCQDEYALQSHRRALEAGRTGHFQDEIVPVSLAGEEELRVDEGPRKDTSLEALSRLKPVFQKNGCVTPGNASQISDGAAALVLVSEEALKRLALQPLARVVASATSGIEPELVMMAPQGAIQKVLKRAGWKLDQVDLFEVNEAFAAQAVALIQKIPLDPERVNVNGGAVALGHPIGASGARILVTLLYALQARALKRGVASLCLGGGNGVAVAVEMD